MKEARIIIGFGLHTDALKPVSLLSQTLQDDNIDIVQDKKTYSEISQFIGEVNLSESKGGLKQTERWTWRLGVSRIRATSF